METTELRMLQALPLDVKIMKTKQRIEEWYRYWCGKVYVSFSGGKDSTVLLHLVRSMYPEVEAVFSDTGLEFPEIREFVKTIDNVKWVKPKMSFNKVIEKYGYPVISKEQSHYIYITKHTKSEVLKNKHINGINRDGSKLTFTISDKWKFLLNANFDISDQCCYKMKKEPIKKYEKETSNNPIVGTMTYESVMREKQYLKNGCNSFNGKRPMSTPISFWTEKDIWDYIKLFNVPYSEIYDMGYDRTGCIFCMYGCHLEHGLNRFQKLQKTHPNLWDYCMKGGEFQDGKWTPKNGLGMAYILDYINVPYMDNIELVKIQGQKYQQFKII